MSILLNKKNYSLILIIVTIVVLLFAALYVYKLKFRVTGYDRVVEVSSSYMDIRFNKKITNFDQIYKDFSVSSGAQLTPSLLGEDKVLRLSSDTELSIGTEHVVTIPLVYSGNKHIDNLHLTFKVVDDSGEHTEFDGNKGAIYDNNLRKYSFMSGGEEIQKDNFFINMQDSMSHDPYFLLTLTPDIQDYSNQESKNQEYLKAFSDFEEYINSFGFKKEDLKIKVMPEYISSAVLGDYDKGLEEEVGDY